MELTTRCPECDTVFAVSLEQLRLRKGYIRCIHCAQIFDGFEAVVPADSHRQAVQPGTGSPAIEPQAPSFANPPLETPPGASRMPDDSFTISAPGRASAAESSSIKPFSIGGSNAAAASGPRSDEPSIPAVTTAAGETAAREPRVPSVLRVRGDMRGSSPPPAGPSFTISEPRDRARAPVGRRDDADARGIFVGDPPPESGADDAAGVDYLFVEPRSGRRSAPGRPEFFDDTGRRSRWMTLVWTILSICGLALLLGQVVYVYRAQVANAFPSLRPTLEAACDRVSCTVPYERRIDSIAITGSALRTTEAPQNDVSRMTLEVTLRNTFDRPQEWPTLVLDLKDASGTVVVRRNLVPDVWVPAQLRSGPFDAGQEISVQVPVSIRGLQANGYQLDQFFP